MLNALRRRSLALAALLFLLAAAGVDLCRHGGELAAATESEATATGLACDDCGDCCSEGAADSHCHACLCACHSAGVLAAATGPASPLIAAPLAALPTPPQAAGFRAALERPPLAS